MQNDLKQKTAKKPRTAEANTAWCVKKKNTAIYTGLWVLCPKSTGTTCYLLWVHWITSKSRGAEGREHRDVQTWTVTHPTQEIGSQTQASKGKYSCRSYSRQGHVVARVQPHLDDSGALDVHLLAGRGVPARHPAGLVEPVRLHAPRVIAHEHLQHHGLVVAFQLQQPGGQLAQEPLL